MGHGGLVAREGDHPRCTSRKARKRGDTLAITKGGRLRPRRPGPCARGQEQAPKIHEKRGGLPRPPRLRSEEHTSELQSLMRISYAVFCLKKKTTQPATCIKSEQTNEHSITRHTQK